MSSIKISETVPQEDRAPAEPVFTLGEPAQAKKVKGAVGPRGSNLTPKSDMRSGRNWSYAQWAQAFKAYATKLERLNYNSKKNASQ